MNARVQHPIGRKPVARTLRLIRRVRRALRYRDPGEWHTPADFSRAATGILGLTRFFYLFTAYGIATDLQFAHFATRGVPPDPLWPIGLLQALMGHAWLDFATAISLTSMIVALLATLFPGMLPWRLGVFLYLFLVGALENSYVYVSHIVHFYVYISFALLFLPPGAGRSDRMSRADTLSCLMVFWFTQSVLLLSYSLSGFWKVWDSNRELLTADGFVRILLAYLMSDVRIVPPLLPLAVRWEFLAQLALLTAVYVELFAIIALFRPHLHRPFGIVLILFHFGTDWLLNLATFYVHIVFLGLFLVFSPLAPARFSLSGMLRSLPILGLPLRAWAALRRPSQPVAEEAWLVYDGECPFCRNYARFLNVRQAVGRLILVNAREGGPLVREIRALPHDLNDGMALKLNGRCYLGHDALHILALLSERRGAFSILNRLLFSSPTAARLGYPVLKWGRELWLKLKGVSPIS